MNIAKDKTINVWHKNGIGETTHSTYKKIKVFKNGRLANTRGKWEYITITLQN